MNRHIALIFPMWSALILTPAVQTAAADWPQFLGLHRTGVSAETGLLSEWPDNSPKIVWRASLGTGMSGLAISGDVAYTMFQDDQKQYLVALNAGTGGEVWRTAVAPMYQNAMGDGPRATPTVFDSSVYVFTGEGTLAAIQKQDGKLLWSVNVPTSLGGTPSEYGMSCSPLVIDDLVIGNLVVVHAGTDAAAVAAFEAASGKLVWKAGAGRAGYSSPMLMELNGVRQIVSLTAGGASGIDAATGKLLWQYSFPTEYDCNTANPVQLDESSLLISAGENHGSVILKVTGDAIRLKVQEVWSSLGKDSQLRAEWQTPVVHNGHLYALDNVGSAGPITNLVCIRLADQKTMWRQPRFGKSNLILADGKLYLTTMKGEVVIVRAAPDEFTELSRAQVMQTTRQAPALSNGRLFVRDDREVLCIELKEK